MDIYKRLNIKEKEKKVPITSLSNAAIVHHEILLYIKAKQKFNYALKIIEC